MPASDKAGVADSPATFAEHWDARQLAVTRLVQRPDAPIADGHERFARVRAAGCLRLACGHPNAIGEDHRPRKNFREGLGRAVAAPGRGHWPFGQVDAAGGSEGEAGAAATPGFSFGA